MRADAVERPDVVIVVMDCVRASDFPPTSPDGEEAILGEGFPRDWVEFPRAISTASWTLPSHASLFTGLYPWVHGVHHRSTLKLGPNFPRLASILNSNGYRTISMASNAFLTPISGLLDGFETVGWCKWTDAMVRAWPKLEPAFAGEFSEGLKHDEERKDSSLTNQLRGLAYNGALKFPFTVDGLNRILSHLSEGPRDYATSPWIERALRNWIVSQREDESIFAFINLMDAHDPYLSDPRVDRSISDWLPKLRVSQLSADYYLNRWSPEHKEGGVLHRLYVNGVRSVSRRLVNIMSILRESRRWENTLFVLTSDHGNAFDEDGVLYHGLKVTEPLTRIPMWVRFPKRRFAGQRATGWASLIDILPTVLDEAGIRSATGWQGVPLTNLIDRERQDPVIAVADGIRSTIRDTNLIPEDIRRQYDRVWVAVYDGNRRVLYDARDDEVTAFSTLPEDDSRRNVWASESESLSRLEAVARQTASNMLKSSRAISQEGVEQRLAAWGY